MVRGSNPGGGEVFRSGPETNLTFLTLGAGCLSMGVTLSTHSLLAPKVPKGHRCTYIQPLYLYGMLQSEVFRYSAVTFLYFQRLSYTYV
jgi:hypothetical protein